MRGYSIQHIFISLMNNYRFFRMFLTSFRISRNSLIGPSWSPTRFTIRGDFFSFFWPIRRVDFIVIHRIRCHLWRPSLLDRYTIHAIARARRGLLRLWYMIYDAGQRKGTRHLGDLPSSRCPPVNPLSYVRAICIHKHTSQPAIVATPFPGGDKS